MSLISLLMGCAARQVAREATPGGVEGTIEALSKPGNRQQIHEIAGEFARQMSHQAVLGTQDGLREANVIGPNSALARTFDWGGVIAIVLGLVVITLVVALLIIVFRARKARERSRRHKADARMKEVLRAALDRPWGKELACLIQDKLGPDALQRATRPRAGHTRI